ncbi:sensor histidine kinase [Rubrolithibacter danxiaensis]|uniref:sensor histidine kinase n=1 Tax=Rubrolithibacter danxiaensis TaxID=3390805 RepID=UPI003BF9036D
MRYNLNKVFLVLILLQIVFIATTFAQEPVIFKGKNIIIGKNISILEDTTNKLDFQSVRFSSNFKESEIAIPNFSLSKSDFWLKFRVNNKTDENDLLVALEYPTLDICEFYYPVEGEYKVEKLSDNNSFNERKYQHPNFLFDINVPKDSTVTFYLRVRSSEQMILPLIIGTKQKIADSLLTRDLLWGILLGALVVMILYNFFVFISTGDKSYLFYVLYTFFIGLTQASLSGYTYHYVFPNSPEIFNKGLVVFPGLAGIFGVLFVKSFLQTKERAPRLNNLFLISIFLYSTAIVLRLIGFDHPSYRMIDISALSTIAIIYLVAIIIALQGYRPAKYYLLAWSMFFTGLILYVLRNLGILPYNSFTNYTMQVGIVFEVILLSLALADKINILKKEKEKSQAQALRAAQENERIIKEQNVFLEQKVNERTAELKKSNTDLHQTLEELKQTQTQLVESEKMASLGQLTAGIAHEINNPINFVTSNVNPLKRDVEILLDAVTKIEDVGLSASSVNEKQQQIEEYKEEIDFDYLKIEISHLLKGIHEGASRTAEIVKGLRIFSRVDEDDLKKANINEGMDSTLVIVNHLLNNNITVEKNYGDIPLIECYPGKLNQVFLNIISNAIHAINKHHDDNPGGKLSISTWFDQKHVFVKIEDNGTGMDENTQKKIFEPFFTTKEVGEGTGLGMSITYNTIKKHNGQIHLQSAPGKGTSFTLELPVIHEIVTT